MLAVEDDLLICRAYERLFRTRGHQCECVQTAESGIDRVRREPRIDALIVDLELRKGDLCGLDVLREAEKYGRVVPIVISGHSLAEVNERVSPRLNPLLQGQAWFFFAKPLMVIQSTEDRSLERLMAIVEAAGRRDST